MRINMGETQEFKRFTMEDWVLFLGNPVSKALLKTLTTDLTIVKTLFTRCLDQTTAYIASKTRNGEIIGKLKTLSSVCDNNLGDKILFESVFNEMLRDFAGYFYGYLKKNGLEKEKDMLEFGYLLKIVFNRKGVFGWKAEDPLDFLKLYEEIENVKIASINEIFSFES
jgi:hypothetical protein